jgi:hypothetical protein
MQPPKLRKGDRKNFETLLRAASDGALALIVAECGCAKTDLSTVSSVPLDIITQVSSRSRESWTLVIPWCVPAYGGS